MERDWKEVASDISHRLADDFLREHKKAEQLEAQMKELTKLVMTNPQEARLYAMNLGYCLKCNELHTSGICDAEDYE
jgi:hypothetical protein